MNLADLVRDIPDFPEPGIMFKDITPVLGDPAALRTLIGELAAPFRDAGITKVAGIEARGFILAAPVAAALEAGFVPIRKPGKLPFDTEMEAYDLEYGSDALEVHQDACAPGDRVLIVDDVIATGGTAAAAVAVLQRIGADVAGISVFIELGFLNGADAIGETPLHALLTYDD